MSLHSQVSWLSGKERFRLSDGSTLRLLTALEVLKARREALELASEKRELALCSNACILAKAWERHGRPCYESGEDILQMLSVSQIQRLARLWAEFDREENPSLTQSQERMDALKKAWSMRLWSAFVGVCSVRFRRSQQKTVSKI